MATKEGVASILKHDITWWLGGARNAPTELDDVSVEFIESCIKQGYVEGELYTTDAKGREFRGWWAISRADKERIEKLEKALSDIAVAAANNADHTVKGPVGVMQKRLWKWVRATAEKALV